MPSRIISNSLSVLYLQ